MDPSRAFVTAQAVLDAVVAHYDDLGEHLPERRLVYPGLLPAWDCEMLGVGVERIFNYSGEVATETIQSIGAHAGFAMQGAALAVWVVRCTPTVSASGSPPTVDELEVNAEAWLNDQQLVRDAIIDATRPTATLATCNGLALVDWQAVTPTGGMVAGVTRVRLGLI